MKRLRPLIFTILWVVPILMAEQSSVDDVYYWEGTPNTSSSNKSKERKSTKQKDKSRSNIKFLEDDGLYNQHPDTVRAIIKR